MVLRCRPDQAEAGPQEEQRLRPSLRERLQNPYVGVLLKPEDCVSLVPGIYLWGREPRPGGGGGGMLRVWGQQRRSNIWGGGEASHQVNSVS